MASIGIGIGIVKTSAKLLVLVLVLLRRFPKVLVLVLGRNFGIAHLWPEGCCIHVLVNIAFFVMSIVIMEVWRSMLLWRYGGTMNFPN